jgi:hypothetical protein
MISLYESEIEFFKVFFLGIFFGWNLRKYFWTNERVKWVTIKNIRFPFMNKKHKK